jgi:Spy/CpxP family protein refolding chaperone
MKQFLPRLAVSLFAVVFVAAQAAPGPARGRGPGADHEGGPLFSVLEKAKTELKLTAEQSAKWQEAEAAGKAARDAMRQDHEKMRAMMDAERQKDILDLAKLDQQMETMMEAGRKAREQAKDKWLAVYDSLSDDQKRLASKRIKEAFACMDKVREHFKDRMQQHQKAGDMPPKVE